MSEMSGQGIVIPTFQPQSSPQQEQPQPNLEGLSEFATGILSGIPESDRATVGKYLKDWDGNVTKKFQSIHDEYKPYKELGDPEALKEAMYYRSMLQDDPANFVQMLQEALKETGMSDDPVQQVEPTSGDGGIAPEIEARFARMEKMMEGAFGQFQQFSSSYAEQQQEAQLDKLLSDMHSKHGQFDDDWVLLQIERGAKPEEAIGAWQENIIKKYGSSTHRPAPVLPPTNGAVHQQNQVDPSKLSKDDRKRFGAEILRANFDS